MKHIHIFGYIESLYEKKVLMSISMNYNGVTQSRRPNKQPFLDGLNTISRWS